MVEELINFMRKCDDNYCFQHIKNNKKNSVEIDLEVKSCIQ